ncbi:hypothetical protein EJ08DRAFT_728901 [Tothia fuscella]|uniref:Uncharacterized protein n=1 Tax=Tothia fuscella TaxID=1048955 RepID=A0A9P4U480_9PEZI|nr:hypothetical protein EJ08DRAFT_728901 [Tothia fuscella]
MVNLVGTLAKRGMEVAHGRIREHHGHPEGQIKLSTPAMILLGVTGIAIFLFASSIEYTIRVLMGHLAMIESPESTTVQIYTPTSNSDDKLDKKEAEAQGLLDVEIEATTVTSTQALTTSIRRTVRHLKSVGGRTAKWRGLGIFIMYTLITSLVSGGFKMAGLRMVPSGETIANLFAALMASRLHCVWTHKIMTVPSDKKPYERKVTRAQWKQLLLPTAVSILARDMSIYTIVYTFVYTNMAAQKINQSGKATWMAAVLAIVPGLIAVIALPIFVMLPAYGALIRKEASLLPEEDETIISFDRTFGGKLAYVTSVLSYADAWKSFTSEARRRVIKLYVKFFFIMVAFVFFASHVLALEFFIVANDQVHQYAEVARQSLQAKGY